MRVASSPIPSVLLENPTDKPVVLRLSSKTKYKAPKIQNMESIDLTVVWDDNHNERETIAIHDMYLERGIGSLKKPRRWIMSEVICCVF